MNIKEIDFDSFSPFWVFIEKDGSILSCSKYFKKFLLEKKNIFETFSFKRMFIKDKKDLYRQFEKKIIDFELSSINLGFRGNLHLYKGLAVIIAWPKLRDISDIRKYNIHVEMSHPCCILTDLLITKDLLKKTQEKVSQIEIQKVESKLFENKERTKNILENMIEGIIVQDENGDVLEFNPAALSILDLNSDDIINRGKVLIERKLIFEERTDLTFSAIFEQFKVAPFVNKLMYFQNKSGDKKYFVLNCSEFSMESKKIYLSTLQDVSEKIFKEKELEAQKEIAHHNAKLASIGELAAGVGHEINNPLAVISGQISILNKYFSKPVLHNEVIDRLNKIKKAITRINNITKGLKTFSRADTSEINDFCLSELVHDTIDMFREILGSDSIIINEDISQNLWIRGNYGRIQQVLVNLLNNARDALEKSSIKEITIILKEVDNYLELVIEDSAGGLDEEVKNKIFEPFFTTKEVNKGTGIGLALVNSIIKEHNGLVNVETLKNKWTRFIIKIPLVDAQIISIKTKEVTKKKSLNSDVKNINSLNDTKISGKILVLDDEEGIREVLLELLISEGHDVISASNGKDGLELFERYKNEISLIISDMKMPLMDGPKFLDHIKKKFNYSGKFIFITGGVNIDISKVEKNVDGVIMKPFDYQEIYNLIDRLKLSA